MATTPADCNLVVYGVRRGGELKTCGFLLVFWFLSHAAQAQLKITTRETVCDEYQCQASAYTVRKTGKIVNWHLACFTENATCQRLKPSTAYSFDIVNQPIPECPHPQAVPKAKACILIHARPFNLNYTAITLLAICGSNTQDCLSGEVYPEQ